MGIQITVYPRGTRRVRAAGPFGVDFDAPTGTQTRRVGTPLFVEQYGKLTNVETSTRYEPGFGGYDIASWTVIPHGGFVGGLMRPGDPVLIKKGGGTCFIGRYSGTVPNDDGTTILQAKGHAWTLYDYGAIYRQPVSGGPDIAYFTTKLGPTTSPAPGGNWDAWQYAVYALGMPIVNVIGDISAWSDPHGASDVAEAPLKVGDLITSVHQELGERWAAWGPTLYIGPDATDPVWKYAAPKSLVGTADTEFASHVNLEYVDSTLCPTKPWLTSTSYAVGDVVAYDGTWWKALVANSHTPPASGSTWEEVPVAYRKRDFSMVFTQDTPDRIDRFDTRTADVDYRGLGPMDDVRAQNIAQQLLDQAKGRFILAGGGFTVTPGGGFMSSNGGVADIAAVRAGDPMQLLGLRDDQGNLMGENTSLISRTRWSCQVREDRSIESESLDVTLLGSVQRDLGELLRGHPLDATGVVAGNGGRAA